MLSAFRRTVLVSLFAVNCLAVTLTATPARALGDYGEWVEETEEDAPEGVPANQSTQGNGDLIRIVGSLGLAGDRVDTFRIVVTNPNTFYATLNQNVHPGGYASFNSRLYLWTNSGQPLLGHEDGSLGATIAESDFFSMITSRGFSSEAGSISLAAGESYLLSITKSGTSPQDASMNSVIELPGEEGELAGPSPTADEFDEWNGESEPPDDWLPYTIALSGATFNEIILAPDGSGDFNHDGVVDVGDFIVWEKNPGGRFAPPDYDTWARRFGEGGGSQGEFGSAAPEPTAIALFLAATALSICVFGRPRR
jgi:hypothetical protein